jgi:hypothetical protein
MNGLDAIFRLVLQIELRPVAVVHLAIPAGGILGDALERLEIDLARLIQMAHQNMFARPLGVPGFRVVFACFANKKPHESLSFLTVLQWGGRPCNQFDSSTP